MKPRESQKAQRGPGEPAWDEDEGSDEEEDFIADWEAEEEMYTRCMQNASKSG